MDSRGAYTCFAKSKVAYVELGSKSWKTDGQNESTKIEKICAIAICGMFFLHFGISFEVFRCKKACITRIADDHVVNITSSKATKSYSYFCSQTRTRKSNQKPE